MTSKLISLKDYAARSRPGRGPEEASSSGSPGGRRVDLTRVPPFRLGDWLVQPALNRVERDGTSVTLEPRVMQLLVLLASRPGGVLSPLELLEALWGDVVVGEEVLTVAVSQLRRALDDDARSPRVLETIHKTGYRLVAPVEPAGSEEAAAVVEAAPAVRRRRAVVLAAALMLTAVAVVALVALVGRRESAPGAAPSLLETADGRAIYHLRLQDPSVWRLDLTTGGDRQVVGPEWLRRWMDEVVLEDGVMALERQGEEAVLGFLDFSTGAWTPLRPLGAVAGALGVAPDRSFVVFDRLDRQELDLVVVDGFR